MARLVAVGRQGRRAGDAEVLCVAEVALGDSHFRFTWQVCGTWRHPPSFCVAGVTSTFVSRGRRGTWRHLLAFGVTFTCVWRGRPGTFCTWWRAWSPLIAQSAAPLCVAGVTLGHMHAPSFHVAGVALGDIHLRFTWQAWHLVASTFVSRGRSGTW